jgi:hypothetical protein
VRSVWCFCLLYWLIGTSEATATWKSAVGPPDPTGIGDWPRPCPLEFAVRPWAVGILHINTNTNSVGRGYTAHQDPESDLMTSDISYDISYQGSCFLFPLGARPSAFGRERQVAWPPSPQCQCQCQQQPAAWRLAPSAMRHAASSTCHRTT